MIAFGEDQCLCTFQDEKGFHKYVTYPLSYLKNWRLMMLLVLISGFYFVYRLYLGRLSTSS